MTSEALEVVSRHVRKLRTGKTQDLCLLLGVSMPLAMLIAGLLRGLVSLANDIAYM